MQLEVIEDIVLKEFKGLCSTCVHVDSCAYFKRKSAKIIIQCEMFEVDNSPLNEKDRGGLCKSCDLADECRLPGRKFGTWHCNEFQ